MAQNGKSSAQLEREAEQTRAELANTLDALRSRLSPGQLVDQALQFSRDNGGGDYVRNFGVQVKNNPVPVALMGLSLAWLMISGKEPPRRPASYARPSRDFGDVDYSRFGEESAADRISGLRDRASDASGYVSEAASRAGGAVSRASGAVTGAASSAYEGATGVASTAYRGASSVVDTTSRAARGAASSISAAAAGIADAVTNVAASAFHTAERVASGAYDTAERTASMVGGASSHARGALHEGYETGRRTGSRAGDLINEQPLVAASIALAIGAALAAMMPATRIENEYIGETADDMKRRAQELANEQFETVAGVAGAQYEKVKTVAEHAWNEAVKEADNQGLTPTQLQEQLKDAVDRGMQSAEQIAEGMSSSSSKDASRKPFERAKA